MNTHMNIDTSPGAHPVSVPRVSKSFRILTKTILRPFYRQNAGQFVFIFIVFIGAVGELEGTATYTGPLYQLHYQYALIVGMLSSRSFYSLVLLAWLAYAEKCTRFVSDTIQLPDHGFLHLLNQLPRKKILALFYRIQLGLFLPILVYSIAILVIAFYKGWYIRGLSVIAYLFLLCGIAAVRNTSRLQHPGKRPWLRHSHRTRHLPAAPAYCRFFIRYIFQQQKILFTGIKLFSCGILYLSARTIAGNTYDYDLRMPAMLFAIAVFGHSILIYRFRILEERSLIFYRGMPIRLLTRFGQYAVLYLIVLIPEIVTLAILTPAPLHISDAIKFLGAGYGFLLLCNSLLLVATVPMKDFLKMVLLFFFILYFSVMAGALGWLAEFTVASAYLLFTWAYYRYDPSSTYTSRRA